MKEKVCSSLRSKAHTQSGRKGDDSNSKPELIPLIFKPLLTALWINGFPVPDLCSHQGSQREDSNSTFPSQKRYGHANNGTTGNNVEQIRAFYKSPRFPHTMGDMSPNEDANGVTNHLPVLSEEEQKQNVGTLANDNSLGVCTLTEKRQDGLHDDLYTDSLKNISLVAKDKTFQTGGEIRDFSNSKGEYIQEENSPSGERKKIKLSEPDEVVVNTESVKKKVTQKDDAAKCRKCRVKKIVGNIIFVSALIVLVVNLLRYTTIFFDVTDFDGSVVASIVIFIFSMLPVYLYVTTYHSLRKHLPRLIQLLQVYDEKYEVSVDVAACSRRLRAMMAFSFVAQVVTSLAISVGFHTFLPTYRRHLSPFSHPQGVGLYLVSLAMAVVLCIIMCISSTLVLLFHWTAFLLIKEFRAVSRRLKLLLASQKGLVSNHNGMNISGGCQDFGGKPQSMSARPKLQCGTGRRSPGKQNGVSGVGKRLLVSAFDGISKIDQRMSTRQDHRTAEDQPRHAAKTISSSQEKEIKSHQAVDHDGMGSVPTIHVTPQHTIPQQANPVQGYAKQLPVAEEEEAVNDLDPRDTANEEEDKAMEDAFDEIRRQHQFLCTILEYSKGCVAHVVAMAYMNGIPVFCLVIYGLFSSSLGSDDAAFMGFVVVEALLSMVVNTGKGIAVNVAAHSPQEVIYASDWSNLSDRLLCKVQLFASRLGHVKLGYDVYGLFVIDSSTVLMVVGTLVTYSVVVIQFQQGDVSTCSTGSNSSIVK